MRILTTLLLAATLGLATPVAADASPGCRATKPMDTAAVRAAISELPSAEANAALVTATGPNGCWAGTSGVADIHTGARVPQDARFRIGSVTKVFTATVVLQLAAENLITLDGTVQQYLPGLLPADYPAVTVRQLLNYTSGLPSPATEDNEGIDYVVAHRFDRWTPQQYVDLALRNPREFEPGTRQHYRNINYMIAGLLIEKTTGHSYADEVRARILRPLKMRDTAVPGNDPAIHGPHVRGYQVMPDGDLRDVTLWNQSFGWAASSIISTTNDLNTFLRALLAGDLLPPTQQNELFTVPPVLDVSGKPASYGGGLQRFKLPGVGELWGKTGSWYGYTAGMGGTRDGSRRLTYALTANDAKSSTNPPALPQKIIAAGLIV